MAAPLVGLVMSSSHNRHGQDETVMSCLISKGAEKGEVWREGVPLPTAGGV